MDQENTPDTPSDEKEKFSLLETVFNAMNDTIWLIDPDFRIRLSNKAAEQFFNLPSHEINGRYCYEIVHGTSEPVSGCPVLRSLKTRKREKTEFQMDSCWFEAVVDPVFDSNGEIFSFSHAITDITSRKKAEEALKARENDLRAILEASLESVFLMDRDGRLIYANQVTAQRLQVRMDTLTAGTMYDFLTETVAENRRQHVRHVLETGLPDQFVDERAGRTILNSIYPVFDGNGRVTHLAVYGVDITERKKLEDQIRENEEKYRNLFRNNHAVLLVIDPESGLIVDANPAASRFYGYPVDVLKTMNILDLNTLDQHQIFEEMTRAKAEKRNYFLFKHKLASGETREVEVYSGPIVDQGRSLLLSIIHDISARRKIEEEKERLIHELSEALSKIKTLKGLIPICASCKKIRDDQGFWQQIESYIRDHSEAEFSHGICPDCRDKLYPNL